MRTHSHTTKRLHWVKSVVTTMGSGLMCCTVPWFVLFHGSCDVTNKLET